MTRPISRGQAQSCEEAQEPKCKCRCGGALHGAARGLVTELPADDPHSPTKGCRRCKGRGHLSQIVFGPRGMGLQLEPCPNCKGPR